MLETRFQQLQQVITLLARLILGGTLFWAGFLKVQNFGESIMSVHRFQVMPYELAKVVGIALPIIEIAVGVLLITGTFTRLAAIAGAGLMTAFIIGIISVWVRGLSIDCGCFGNGAEVDPSQTQYLQDILRDLGLLLCGLWAIWQPRSKLAIDRFLFPLPAAKKDENG